RERGFVVGRASAVSGGRNRVRGSDRVDRPRPGAAAAVARGASDASGLGPSARQSGAGFGRGEEAGSVSRVRAPLPPLRLGNPPRLRRAGVRGGASPARPKLGKSHGLTVTVRYIAPE